MGKERPKKKEAKSTMMSHFYKQSEFYQQNIYSLYPSVSTDGNILLVYTERITVGK